jgi:DNA anti-recombination protein RmuC
MGTAEIVAIGLAVLGGIFTVLWWLLRQKDEKQAHDIEKINEALKDLYLKHRDDERELYALRIKIAENHPPKQEIEKMISDMKQHFDQRFDQLLQVMAPHGGK